MGPGVQIPPPSLILLKGEKEMKDITRCKIDEGKTELEKGFVGV